MNNDQDYTNSDAVFDTSTDASTDSNAYAANDTSTDATTDTGSDSTDSTSQDLVDPSGNGWTGYMYSGSDNSTQSAANDATNSATDASNFSANGFTNLSPYQANALGNPMPSSITLDQLAQYSTTNPDAGPDAWDPSGHKALDANVNASDDRSVIYGDMEAILQYQRTAAKAGLSAQQIKTNITNMQKQASSQAAYNNLDQYNAFDMDARNDYMHHLGDTKFVGSEGMSKKEWASVAANNLASALRVTTADKNALKYDDVLQGMNPDQVNKDLDAADGVVNNEIAQGYKNAEKYNKKIYGDKSTKSTANDKTSSKTDAKAQKKELYASSIKVREVTGKDGKPKFKFEVAAKERGDVKATKGSGKYLNAHGQNRSHYQSMSKSEVNQILAANGMQALTNSQLSKIAKSGQPLANAKDGLAFDAKVKPSQISGRNRIVAGSITKPAHTFSATKQANYEAAMPKTQHKAASRPATTHAAHTHSRGGLVR